MAATYGPTLARQGWRPIDLLRRIQAMTTASTDGVKWSVALPLFGVMASMAAFIWMGGGIAENVRNLSRDMDGIKDQFRIQGATLIRLDEGYKNLEGEIKRGADRMDKQDTQLAAIKAQLDALHDQVEHQQPRPK